jgi:hypothetical protein
LEEILFQWFPAGHKYVLRYPGARKFPVPRKNVPFRGDKPANNGDNRRNL